MKPLHVAVAVLVAIIWGLAFVATKIGLNSFSPPQLTFLRFAIASVPAFVLARPPIRWSVLVAAGLTLFAGQFLLQFFGIALGMPPGLASIVVQTQALFTILFAALVLREKPTRRQLIGVAIAASGLGLIAVSVGPDLSVAGFTLTTLSAVSWGIGNILVKRLERVQVLDLVVWLSLVPPLPAAALSMMLDGPADLGAAMVRASWLELGAVIYLGAIATVVAYAMWGKLLRQYPAAAVTPFALLAPFVAASASSVVFDERFGALRVTGIILVLLALAIIVLPVDRWPRGRRPPLVISAAGGADAPGVVALIGRVFAEYGFVYEPATEVPDLVDFDAHYQAPRGAFFVVRVGERVVGSVGVERLDADTAELHRLYLDAHLRGRGTGRALVEAVLDWCRIHAISHVILWSDTRFEQAHRLYERMGFRLTGERELPADVNRTREYRFERLV